MRFSFQVFKDLSLFNRVRSYIDTEYRTLEPGRSNCLLCFQITFAVSFFVTVIVVTDIFAVDVGHVQNILGIVSDRQVYSVRI